MLPKRIADLYEISETPDDTYDGIYDPKIGRDFKEMLEYIEWLRNLVELSHSRTETPAQRSVVFSSVRCHCGWHWQGKRWGGGDMNEGRDLHLEHINLLLDR